MRAAPAWPRPAGGRNAQGGGAASPGVRFAMAYPGKKSIVRQAALLAVLALTAACSTLQEHGTLTVAAKGADSLSADDLSRYGIAFVTPLTVTGQEQDRASLALIFSQVLQEMRPGVRIVPLAQTLGDINRAGIADDYKRFMANYHGGELLDKASLVQISKATGARYIAELKMASFLQESEGRFGILGLQLIDTKKSSIRLSLQIWNSQDGSIAWEGTHELYLASDTVQAKPIPFRQVVEASARKLVAAIP
jgi:hypothetical protein